MAEQGSGPSQPRPRRTLGPRLTALLVLDVLLVAALVVVFVMTRDGGEEPVARPSGSVGLEETPEASAPADPETSQALAAFVLPSGNIHCAMTETQATCTILSFSFEAPALEGCAGTVGNVVTVEAGQEARFVCVDGDVPPVPEGATELAYGEGSTVGEMTCLSSENGVYCRHNTSGKGFALARAGATFF